MANFEEDIDFGNADLITSPIEGLRYLAKPAKVRQAPGYALANAKFTEDLYLAQALEAHKRGTLEGDDVEGTRMALYDRLRNSHPVIPILSGEVSIENPTLQLPLVFKLYQPKVKDLNSHYGESATNDLMARVQDLFVTYFGSSRGGLPIATLLNRDFKGGKALLNLNSPDLDSTEPWKDFQFKAEAFQFELTRLVHDFDDTHGNKFPSDLEARMVFGCTDRSLAPDPQNLALSDHVEHFLLAEHVANMAQRRRKVSGAPGAQERGHAIKLSGKNYVYALEVDFKRVAKPFSQLYKRHKDEPLWAPLFRHEDPPFLSLDAIQCLRKGQLQEKFPFLTEEDVNCFANLVEVVNTVDVLKPFLEEGKELFYKRLASTALLLVEKPTSEEEKKDHLTRLAAKSRVHLKDQVQMGQPISQTRLAFAERVYSVLCGDESVPTTVLIADVKAFSPSNISGYYFDLLALYSDPDLVNAPDQAALRTLLTSSGDLLSHYLRRQEAHMVDCYSGALSVVSDATGGDEMVASVASQSLDSKHERFLESNDVRLVAASLPVGARMDVKTAADLLARIFVFAERLFEIVKKLEVKNENISLKPVNITIVQ